MPDDDLVEGLFEAIVATDVNDCVADVTSLIPMTEQSVVSAAQTPGLVLATT